MTILETHQLTKEYRRIVALRELDLVVKSGMVFGLLGPNGSGKTTTLGILLSVLKPTAGTFNWFGKEPSAESRKQIGAILETPSFYNYLSGNQNLSVAARIKQCHESHREAVLRQVGLYERRDDPYRTYSLGMKQRLAIASALLADPQVLILDEPTNGLDPQGIVEIRQLIREIAQSGKTIILASHLLDEVQKVCSHFCVLHKGKKLYQGSVRDTLNNQKRIELAAKDLEMLVVHLRAYPELNSLERLPDRIRVSLPPSVTTEKLNQFLIERGVVLNMLMEKMGSLEQQFLQILAEHE